MITVASYLKGIPPSNKNPEKEAIINNFVQGVNRLGDQGVVVPDHKIRDVDVAVIQGFVHTESANTRHLALRRDVYNHQAIRNRRTIIVDSNLFLYADPGNSKTYLRYSYDGIFPSTGEYCNENPDPRRWNIISKQLGISLKPWRTKGSHIVLFGQRDGGWTMDGQPVAPWILKTIKKIRNYTDRPIRVRLHPKDKRRLDHQRRIENKSPLNVTVSSAPNILDDLRGAHAAVSYNSSPGVIAAIEGIPVFVLDPTRSQAGPVAHTELSSIENTREIDREFWIQQMAQMHWSFDELKDGSAWAHLRKWAIK